MKEISEPYKTILADELALIREKMDSELDPMKKVYYYSAAYAMVQRIFKSIEVLVSALGSLPNFCDFVIDVPIPLYPSGTVSVLLMSVERVSSLFIIRLLFQVLSL